MVFGLGKSTPVDGTTGGAGGAGGGGRGGGENAKRSSSKGLDNTNNAEVGEKDFEKLKEGSKIVDRRGGRRTSKELREKRENEADKQKEEEEEEEDDEQIILGETTDEKQLTGEKSILKKGGRKGKKKERFHDKKYNSDVLFNVEDTSLPPELRARQMQVAEFTSKETDDVDIKHR